jgi:metal-responsive CopG/Arc/MetJ family transcriptional regulator
MKVKTSVTLSEELLRAIENEVKQENRSSFIEEATWSYLRAIQRGARDREDLKAIEKYAEELNAEALDVLEYQDQL